MTPLFVVFAVAVVAGLLLWRLRRSPSGGAGSEAGPSAEDSVLDPAPAPRGWEWRARLSLDTPLESLERHGEWWAGAAPPPPDEEGRTGRWVSIGGGSGGASSAGSGEAGGLTSRLDPDDRPLLLAFLKDFRRIVEGPEPVDDQVVLIRSLPEATPEYRRITGLLDDDFPISWFAGRFTRIHGIGPGTARALFDAGLRTARDVAAASDEELLAIHGVGPSTVSQIRAQLSAVADGRTGPERSGPTPRDGEDAEDSLRRQEREAVREKLGHEASDFEVAWSLLQKERDEFARSGMQAESLLTRVRMGELLESHGRGREGLQVYLEVCFREAAQPRSSRATAAWERARSEARRLAGELDLDMDQVEEILNAVRERGSRALPAWADVGERWESLGIRLLEDAAERERK